MLSLTLLLLAQSSDFIGGGFTDDYLSISSPNRGNGSRFGSEMAGVGDLNGDGIGEYLIADPIGGTNSFGEIFIYSGATGFGIFTSAGYPDFKEYGAQVAGLEDINGDGISDFIVCAPGTVVNQNSNAGMIFVYSGADFSVIYQIGGTTVGQKIGSQLELMGDLDGDGITDFAASTAPPTGVNQDRGVFFYSGATGSQLGKISNVIVGTGFGNAIANAGDHDGDGLNDILIGEPTRGINGVPGAGAVSLYSTATGQKLLEVHGNDTSLGLGTVVAGVGDQNFDGIPDFIAAAPLANNSGTSDPKGIAKLFSGADLSVIWQSRGSAYQDRFGSDVCVLGDLNRDGAYEFAITAPGAVFINPNLFIYKGGNGNPVLQSVSESVDYIDVVGDIFGDGGPDLLKVDTKPARAKVTGINYDPYVYSEVSELSAATGGDIPFEIAFPVTSPWPYKVLISGSGVGPTNNNVDIPLGNDQLYVNSMGGIYPGDHHDNLLGNLSPSGTASARFSFPLRLAGSLIGRTFWYAVVTFPAGSPILYSSAARSVLIVP